MRSFYHRLVDALDPARESVVDEGPDEHELPMDDAGLGGLVVQLVHVVPVDRLVEAGHFDG